MGYAMMTSDMETEKVTERFFVNAEKYDQPFSLSFVMAQTPLQTAFSCPAIQSFDGYSITIKGNDGRLIGSAEGTVYKAIPTRAFSKKNEPLVSGFDADLNPVMEWMTENVARLSHFPENIKTTITQVFVASVFVDPQYRRLGIGSVILDFLKTKFSPYAICAWDWGAEKPGALVPTIARKAGNTVELCQGAHFFLERNGFVKQKMVHVASLSHDVALTALQESVG